MLMRRPRDSVAVLAALTAVIAIVVNATYLQHGRHPAPIFALRPLPVAAAATEVVGGVARPSAEAVRHDGARPAPATSSAARGSRNDAIAELLSTHPAPAQLQSPAQPQPVHQAAVPAARPSVPIPPPARPQPSRQVLGVQRALSEFGYGQLKPTGVFDAETRARQSGRPFSRLSARNRLHRGSPDDSVASMSGPSSAADARNGSSGPRCG